MTQTDARRLDSSDVGRRRPCLPRRRWSGVRRTSRSRPRRSKPALSRSGRHSAAESQWRPKVDRRCLSERTESERACAFVPVGALEDPGLALEPAAFVSSMSSRLGAKTSKTRRPPGSRSSGPRAERPRRSRPRLHVQQRPEGAEDERTRSSRAARAGLPRRRSTAARRRPARPPRQTASMPSDESTPTTRIPARRRGWRFARCRRRARRRAPVGPRLLDVEVDVLGDRRLQGS